MSKERFLIATINGTEIYAVNHEGETYVPIRPICTAIGVDYSGQIRDIKSDPTLSTVVGISPTTGADGKTYDMVCLPLKYIYGWLFTINPGKVSPEARETVTNYRRECYEVLYEHFTAKSRYVDEVNAEEKRLIEEIQAKESHIAQIKQAKKDAETRLARLRNKRLEESYPTLF